MEARDHPIGAAGVVDELAFELETRRGAIPVFNPEPYPIVLDGGVAAFMGWLTWTPDAGAPCCACRTYQPLSFNTCSGRAPCGWPASGRGVRPLFKFEGRVDA